MPQAMTDAMKFCCPHCQIELRCLLELDLEAPRMILDPVGFQLDGELESDPSGEIITVATDLPVHRVRHAQPLNDGGSPFLHLASEMPKKFPEWISKVHALQHLRQSQFEVAEQLVSFARTANWKMASDCLGNVFGEQISNTRETIQLTYKAFSIFYAPLLIDPPMFDYLDEYFDHLNECMENKKPAYESLLTEWSTSHLYRGFRLKALSSFLRVLSHFDAFVVGLLFHEMPDKMRDDIGSYRIFRDDYAFVKSLYQDLFELTSQLLIFLGNILNLSIRGDADRYSTGETTTKKFIKQTACNRFKILPELPLVSTLLGNVSRPMRNSIGHFSADYEPCTGNLRYDDGSHQNYIAFLGDFYSAVKSLWFILVFVEKTDVDMHRLNLKVPVA